MTQETGQVEPRVSVVIPVRNRPALVVQTLASLRAQTLESWEAVVVDDGSTDDTPAAVERVAAADGRVRLIRRTQGASGAPASRNAGVAAARGGYVVFLDSDDLLMPEAMERRAAFMDARPELDFAVARQEMFDHEPGDTGLLFNSDTGEDDLDRFLAHDNPWQTTGPTWRRAALERVGPWDEALACGQDVDQHQRALLAGLRYERIDGCDTWVRSARDAREKISANVMAERLLPAQAARVRKTLTLMREAGELTDKRRELTAANWLAIGESYRDAGRLRTGLARWREARAAGLTTRGQWLAGAAYLALRGRWLAALVFAHMWRRWPEQMLLGARATMCRVSVDTPTAAPRTPVTDPHHRYYRYREIVTDGTLRYVARRLNPARIVHALRRRLGGRGAAAGARPADDRSGPR